MAEFVGKIEREEERTSMPSGDIWPQAYSPTGMYQVNDQPSDRTAPEYISGETN